MTWLLVTLAVWLVLLVFFCCLLAAAGRADRRTDTARPRRGAGGVRAGAERPGGEHFGAA